MDNIINQQYTEYAREVAQGVLHEDCELVKCVVVGPYIDISKEPLQHTLRCDISIKPKDADAVSVNAASSSKMPLDFYSFYLMLTSIDSYITKDLKLAKKWDFNLDG